MPTNISQLHPHRILLLLRQLSHCHRSGSLRFDLPRLRRHHHPGLNYQPWVGSHHFSLPRHHWSRHIGFFTGCGADLYSRYSCWIYHYLRQSYCKHDKCLGDNSGANSSGSPRWRSDHPVPSFPLLGSRLINFSHPPHQRHFGLLRTDSQYRQFYNYL